jgi:hypothetical protein
LNILAGQVHSGQPVNPVTAGLQGICPQVCPGRLEFYPWFLMQCAIAPTIPPMLFKVAAWFAYDILMSVQHQKM